MQGPTIAGRPDLHATPIVGGEEMFAVWAETKCRDLALARELERETLLARRDIGHVDDAVVTGFKRDGLVVRAERGVGRCRERARGLDQGHSLAGVDVPNAH